MALTTRDKLLLKYLARFRVLSRKQISDLICPEVANPTKTANEILLRLTRDGHLVQLPRPRGEPFLYMPNPPLIQRESAKTRHFLGIADLFLALGQPAVFAVEPKVSDDYQPDVYARLPQPVIIEYQRSRISNKEMQGKVDRFHAGLLRGDHDAQAFWIASNAPRYKIKNPEGIVVAQTTPSEITALVRKDKESMPG